MIKRGLLIAVLVAAVMSVVGTAQAANTDRSGRLVATPAAVCTAIVSVNPSAYSTYAECMANLNKDVAAYRFPDELTGSLISLDERCTQFEQGMTDPETGETFVLTYPFTFEEGPDWPFPVFTAQNHVQCENTLFAYHSFFGV